MGSEAGLGLPMALPETLFRTKATAVASVAFELGKACRRCAAAFTPVIVRRHHW
jgi:hypothetical protein